jgi:hypothetical protein
LGSLWHVQSGSRSFPHEIEGSANNGYGRAIKLGQPCKLIVSCERQSVNVCFPDSGTKHCVTAGSSGNLEHTPKSGVRVIRGSIYGAPARIFALYGVEKAAQGLAMSGGNQAGSGQVGQGGFDKGTPGAVAGFHARKWLDPFGTASNGDAPGG